MPKLKQKQTLKQRVSQVIERVLVAIGAKLTNKLGQVWQYEAIAERPKLGSEGLIVCTRGSGCGKEYVHFPPSAFDLKIENDKLVK